MNPANEVLKTDKTEMKGGHCVGGTLGLTWQTHQMDFRLDKSSILAWKWT